MSNSSDSSNSRENALETFPLMFPAVSEGEIFRIADNTCAESVGDLSAMATPKKRPPVCRLPTNNPKSTPKLLMKTVSKFGDPEDSPLSEPDLTLPSLPSISHLSTYSEKSSLDVLMELKIPPTPRSPLFGRNATAGGILREAESINIENLLQRGDVDATNLLDVELSAVGDDLDWE